MSVQASSLMAAIAAVTGLVWRTVIENRMPWRRQEAMTLPDQNPESPRSVSGPVALARRTRPARSLTNRSAPRAVLAEPVRIRRWSSSPVSALLASSGW
jgi:hypothetical protein